MQKVQIKDHKLVRDLHSKAVLNTDRNGLEEYLVKKEISKKQSLEQIETKKKIQQIEEDMAEIKKLLLDIATLRKP
jgi:hypothetical protein